MKGETSTTARFVMGYGNRITILTAFALLASAFPVLAQIPLGSEFRVDTRGFTADFWPWTPRSAAVAPNGDFVLTWSTTADGDHDVVARRFDAAGRARGSEFRVNTYTTGYQYNDAVGMDDGGNFVVVWWNYFVGGPSGILAQRFDASGARRGAEFRVDSSGGLQPSVAMAPGGEFVVVWVGPDGNYYTDVFGQRYDAAGSPAGAEFRVNTFTTGQQYVPTVDFDGAGNFVVVWASTLQVPGDLDVFGQRFTADAARQGTEFAVNSNTFGAQARSRVARSRDGSFVVTWWGAGADDPDGGVFARRFDAGGLPVGPDFRVNEFTTGQQDRPDVDVDADGDFVITWRGHSQNGGTLGVFARRFDAMGADGGEFTVNTDTTELQSRPAIANDPAGNFVIAWFSYAAPGVGRVVAQRYAGGLSAAALAVDASAGPTSDGNGVFEAGETVTVAPAWLNANFGAQSFTGTAPGFNGPGAPGDPTYMIADAAASYGTVASNATASCTSAADCYALGTTVPSTRPAQHWDASVHEQISPANLGAAKTWSLHIGDSFADVPRASGFYRFVETLLHHGITGGCSATQYCPLSTTTREQMAAFVLVAKEGAGYVPPACTTPMFADVPASSPFCRWIEELARRGVVAGCGGGNYCPAANVSREQMAVFVLLTKEPGLTPPACGTPMFNDVPASSPFCRWIEELARRGVVTGCGGGNYCPTAAVTREQMAVFLSGTFGLMLYGP
jgi:S-layer family protein